MPFGSQRADLLERSLQGHESTDQEVRDLLATVGRIPTLTSPACAPRPEFVSALAIKLHAEALTLPAREIRPAPSTTGARRSAARPLVFVIGRGLPRILAGATASLLLVGAVVGGASRSALPGSLLYPVKQLLDQAAVQLAGSDFDRGTTLLSQAQDHIGEAATLVDRDGSHADPASVDQALLGAYDAVSGGQRALLGEFDRTGNPQALIAVQAFVARTLPQLDALRPLVPADSKPDVDALITLLQDSRTSLARKVAVCGQPCASLSAAALGNLSVSPPLTGAPATPSADVPSAGSTAITGPGGVVVGPTLPPPLTTGGGTIRVSPPVVTLGPIVVSPPPIVNPPVVIPPVVIPPIVIPPLLSPAPVPTSVTSILPNVLPLPTDLLGLP